MPPLATGILYTDQYELTMAQLYFRHGLHERTVLFEHYFRDNPNYGAHSAGFCVNAGMGTLLEWMQAARFDAPALDALRAQRDPQGARIFGDDFLEWLKSNGSFDALTLRAIPEGRVVHPDEPLTVVQGPAAMAQLLETALLNVLNYQTLIATKAARVAHAATLGSADDELDGGRVVLEFGMRRAQGLGANDATRAALIGGAQFSSNVGMSHALGYPPRGTHAHSMVQLFMALGGDELAAFRAYADVYPDDCLLLVDTVHTLESGVPHAITVFEELRRKGHTPRGIRLDSGDLAYLAIQSAKMLNDAGFPDTAIVLSSDLDELVIWQILTQIQEEAPRSGVDPAQLIGRLVYGVGTRLVTSWGQPALGGVYKLVAVQDRGAWQPALKLSDSPDKIPNPGSKQVWRLYDRRNKATADLLALDHEDPPSAAALMLHHPSDAAKFRTVRPSDLIAYEPLLEPVSPAAATPAIEEMRARRLHDIARLDPGVRRLVNPHLYHVSLTDALWELKQGLIRGIIDGVYLNK